MAEGFREYVMNRDSRTLGQKILDFFKNLLIKTTNWKHVTPHLTVYYRMINEGKYANKIDSISSIKDLRSKDNIKYIISSNTQIKPGVSELFESNPELANAVYVALGFKQNITKDLAKSKHDTDEHRFSIGNFIKEKNSVRVTKNREGDFSIHEGDLSELTKQQKIALFQEQSNAIPIGGQIVQRGASSFDGIRHRINLKNHGFSIKYGTDNLQEYKSTNKKEVQEFSNLHNLGEVIEKDGKLFTKGVILTKEKNIDQITPQQKQQAIKQYSKYLDTIFPDSKVKDIVYHGASEKFDNFSSEKRRVTNTAGIYFSNSKKFALSYTPNFSIANREDNDIRKKILALKLDIYKNGESNDKKAELSFLEKKIINIYDYIDVDYDYLKIAIVNLTNPLFNNALIEDIHESILEKKAIDSGNDGVVISNDVNNDRDIDTIIIPNSSQIHILGSKQDIEGFKEFVSNTKSRKDVDNNRDVNNLNFNTLDSETLKALKDKKWTEEIWNSVSQIEREQAIKCISF